ncbi:MAG: LacI family transcriptional regulator [Lachnospiraceae bacterium]|nr:LacI family transcriptional regulator [Lachnospiraceae bacterium]
MNIYDVSKRAGVSIATVSRVLNGNPNVSEKTRTKVLTVMAESGYTPNVFARGLGLGTMKTIGIMCSDSSDPYLANAIYHLERQLRSHGYDSLLCCTGTSLENKRIYFELLLSKRVDAVILAGSKFVELIDKNNDYLIEAAKEIPVMLVNGYLDFPGIYSTVCNDYQAMYDAVSRLIASGKRNILYLYTSHSYSGLNKVEGYKNALTDHNIPVRREYIHQCPKDLHQSKKLMNKLFGIGLEFDAVMTSDDSLAVGAVKYASEKKIRIPDELAVIGYNNSLLSYCTNPEISSIDTKVEQLCTTTVETLMRVFDGGSVPAKTVIAAEFIQKQTTNF